MGETASRLGSITPREDLTPKRRILDIERHQKMQSISLRVGLQHGFMDLVQALDKLARVIEPTSTILPDTLRDRTSELLETKGVQAIYWLQLMKEVTNFVAEDLAKAVARPLAVPPPEAPTGEPSGSAARQLRIWFEDHRNRSLSLADLEHRTVEQADKLESNCDDNLARLHVHYGRLLDDSRVALLTALETVQIGERPLESEERGLSLQAAANVFESIHRIVGSKETTASETAPSGPQERFFGTAANFCVVIPPKIIRLNLPTGAETPVGLLPTCCGLIQAESGETSGAPRSTFHVQLPQQELRIPGFILERYAREVLFKGYQITKIVEAPPLPPVPEIQVQEEAVAEPSPRLEAKAEEEEELPPAELEAIESEPAPALASKPETPPPKPKATSHMQVQRRRRNLASLAPRTRSLAPPSMRMRPPTPTVGGRPAVRGPSIGKTSPKKPAL